ncbi:nuclear transport factor 2 family protein (plasmid) [Cupriavidus sp. P-10]|uniref:nuclear transport factor 2 family protein n=1 Tax=Cupriavidus sp. P-10 TaxID=2027911 RepID=UPI000E2EF1F4|nr:nuclear transport factor 2 family protein [Cupriavidus sp. P-10]BDB28671.1 nuclear transport factor 2 family protein [Cupriavidus sp. P-10]
MQDRLQAMLDKCEIAEVVQTERAARDQAQWTRMLDTYHPDSVVDLSWFFGSGPEFVAASQRLFEAGRHSAHQMGPTLVTLRGDRALAHTPCAVAVRTRLDGVEVDVTTHSRLHERMERRDGAWRIARMGIVYLRDGMTVVNPCERVEIDAAMLATYRPTYRFLSYLLAQAGQQPRLDLPGIDRPETVRPLLDRDEAWLAGIG